jgi:UDP-N-acetylglucosamine--N-acetylmuramyl-(pentapeptide) pyrophosphoryl-undecaprenol N-acetylglucosamine transferase
LWPQTELNPSALAAWLQTLRRPELMAMAERARALAKMQAAERVAAICAESAGANK